MGERSRDKTKKVRTSITEERRKSYVSQDWPSYEQCVQRCLDLEDKAAQTVLAQVLEMLQISEDEFSMTHRKLANDETSAQFVMAAQQGKLKQDKVVK